MRIRIEVDQADGIEEAEVIVVNGGREEIVETLKLSGEETYVDIMVPQAVVIREKYVEPQVG